MARLDYVLGTGSVYILLQALLCSARLIRYSYYTGKNVHHCVISLIHEQALFAYPLYIKVCLYTNYIHQNTIQVCFN